ncbi:MAG: type 1 glutamine amidotransferase [Nevskia sp.]|nr:type 1 glutamine amidotransferase [Nevskia sp.]
MRIHWLQHADFEDLGCIGPWLAAHGHVVSATRLYAGERPPPTANFDALIVMGGPMNIYQHERHPWLVPEKALIRGALDSGKRVLGLCLGAQLLADVLGGPVTRNADREIGWFPVTLTEAGRAAPLLADLPDSFTAFHWHGDTYALPPDAQQLAFSEACAQQAFSAVAGRALGLQFHLEVTQANAQIWFEHARPKVARYVQTPEHILAQPACFDDNNRFMRSILARFLAE